MKKLAIIAATSAILSSTAFAENSDYYLKASIGGNMMNKVSHKTSDAPNVSLKSKTAAFLELGAGYNVMDNFHTDLTFAYFFDPELKKSAKITSGSGKVIDGKFKHKAKIMSLLLNGTFDVADMGVAKLFLGAGVGAAQVKEKVSFSGTEGGANASSSSSSKTKTNFAYQLTLGACTEVSDGVHAELAYSWRDFGKTKAKATGYNYSSRYRSHNVAVGVKFDI